jgi:hypothetical protein
MPLLRVRETLWCRNCQSQTLHIGASPNHLLHFALSVLTVGLWLPFWIWISLTQDIPRCIDCGGRFSGPQDDE